ncbi:MAG: M23 family metallopeptidase [Endomicrobiaceae bacterium]|nr:M23 family metallopeptidase [Endomicrobiaceae bacterium]
MKNIIIRWTIFCVCLFVVYFVINAKVHAIAQANLQSAMVVNLPQYTKQELIDDAKARMKYMLTRTKGVKFFIHKVKSRENLWGIAKQHGYSVHTVIGCNPQMKTYNVSINQNLLMPSIGGNLHPVSPTDTWQSIAEKYNIDENVLKETNCGVTDLSKEFYVFIPGKKPAVDLLNESMQEKYALRDLFRSPLAGRLSSTFGTRKHPVTGKISKHGGIDIAVKTGTLVGAAADGIVTVASTNVGHYGTAVFIDHQNGYITHYGHLSKILVRVGQKVKAGQIIAKSGSTGRSTGPHLHFTVKKNGVSLDPLKFLW